MGIDWKLFQLANSLAGRSPILDAVIRLLMNDYALTTALVLVLFALWFSGHSHAERERHQRAVLSAVTALVIANLIVKALNLVYWRWRPFAFHDVTLLFYHPSDSSFPSNAATVGFCIATAIWLFDRKMGAILYLIAALFGVSRVVGGVHYPSDILGGILIGGLTAYWVARRMRFLDRLWTIVIARMRSLLLA
jgi:undecaprenyl-diphosphatase